MAQEKVKQERFFHVHIVTKAIKRASIAGTGMKKQSKIDPKLNQDINRNARRERFPESNMAKESVEDAERMKGAQSGRRSDEHSTFPDDFPQGAD
jgi:hypothetical protein